MNTDEKVCPRCAETIKRAAVICRFCRHEFLEGPVSDVAGDLEKSHPTATLAPETDAASDQASAGEDDGKQLGRLVGFGCLGFILLAAVAAAIGGGSSGSDDVANLENLTAENLVIENDMNAVDMNAVDPVTSNMSVDDFAAVGSSTPSSSQVPYFDTQAHCREVSEVGGTGSYTIEESCRQMEAEAQADLERMAIPDRVYNHCKEVAEVGGAGSYTIMKSCVEMEIEAASRL